MVFNIWRIADGKAGHDSQSIGLCNAIKKLKNCKRFDIPVEPALINYKHLLLKQFPLGNKLPKPDIIIGAGHGTHLPMLCAKRAHGGKTIVLMKPSLPLSFFDICITPEHDQVADKKNIIRTRGAINPIQFNESKLSNTGLFLLGGPSKHYHWDDESIINQIKQIVISSPDVQWNIADSPRTPKTTLNKISNTSNIKLLSYKNTDSEAIREIIFKTRNIWVSRESVSMIYEALSSGAAVGLLHMEKKNKNKISDAIDILIHEKQLCSFEMWKNDNKLTPPSFKFNEADRCASLLLEQGILT